MVKVVYLISLAVIIALTVANISFYRGKGPLKDRAMPLSISMLVMQVINLIGWSMNLGNDLSYFISEGLLTLVVVINIFCLLYLQRQRVDVHSKKVGTEDEAE